MLELKKHVRAGADLVFLAVMRGRERHLPSAVFVLKSIYMNTRIKCLAGQ